MIFILNIQKEINKKIGINLINTNNGVQIESLAEFPNLDIRKNILIGDFILSVNGKKSETAYFTSKYIIENGPIISLCINREDNQIFEKNKYLYIL